MFQPVFLPLGSDQRFTQPCLNIRLVWHASMIGCCMRINQRQDVAQDRHSAVLICCFRGSQIGTDSI